MSFFFTVDEIFALAEQIEQNGERFYRRAAEKVKEKEARQLLLKLADFEVEHGKVFRTMREELSEAERRSITFDPANETALYLSSLARISIFPQGEADPSELKDIFQTALTAEKDSIAFYLGMKELVETSSGKEKIEEIIREEMRHIRLLGERLVGLR